MKIVGDSIQEGTPTPENPKEIKHEPKIVIHTIDGGRNNDTYYKRIKRRRFYF